MGLPWKTILTIGLDRLPALVGAVRGNKDVVPEKTPAYWQRQVLEEIHTEILKMEPAPIQPHLVDKINVLAIIRQYINQAENGVYVD